MNTATTTPRRRRGMTIAGVATGLALVIATPLAASAHVHVDPGEVTAGSTETLEFAFSHGCDGSPTTALVIDIPDAVSTVKPIIDGAWTISRELADDGIATQVTYTAATPIEDGLKATVSMDVMFGEDAADSDVAFPVTQTCADGENAWVEIAEEGADADALDSPAPVVTVGAYVEDDGHGHAAETEATDAEHTHDEADADAAAAASESSDVSSADAAPLWLAGGALVVAIAALVVALVRGRSRNS